MLWRAAVPGVSDVAVVEGVDQTYQDQCSVCLLLSRIVPKHYCVLDTDTAMLIVLVTGTFCMYAFSPYPSATTLPNPFVVAPGTCSYVATYLATYSVTAIKFQERRRGVGWRRCQPARRHTECQTACVAGAPPAEQLGSLTPQDVK